MTDLQRRIAALSPQQRELLEQRLADLTASRPRAREDRIEPRDRSGSAPLAIQQQREWTFAQYRSANNIPGAFRVEGKLDPALLSRVLTEVVERHEVLRSTVETADDGTRAQVVHASTPVPTPVIDLSHLMPDQQQEEVHRRWEAEVVGPFDPAQPQRLRVSLLRLAERTHVVLITTDHAAADLASVGILVQEFAALYALRLNGDGGGLPPLDIQYGDYAAWQREVERERTAAELEHWRRVLDGIPGGLALPSDRPYPAEPTFAGATHRVELSPELTAELRRFGEREKVSFGAVLIAACSVLLYRYLEQDDVVIGEIVSGRNRSQLEQLIGCFVGALPVRMRLADDQTLREVVRQAHDTVVTASDHQDLPFDSLLERLDLGAEVTQASLVDMWLDIVTPASTLAVPGLSISAEPVESSLAATPLTLGADLNSDALRLQWMYMTEVFDADTVAVLADQFTRLLRHVVTAPDVAVGQLELAVGPAVTATAPPADAGFVELFRRRVAAAPHAPAVSWDGVATSYADLDRDAGRLARHLRALGVGPDTRVGILLDRSPLLAVAILGVLRAGAAYVPLDPAYPVDRIEFMLADADATVLVTQERLADLGSAFPCETVLLDGPSSPVGTETGPAADDPLDDPDPRSLAYVAYTSGSTGRPKGAMIEHGSLVTFARDVADRLGLGVDDRFLQFASPGFDVLAEELFPIWLAGGSVGIPTRPLLGGGDDLVELIERERLTVIELPTAYWHEWVRELDRLGRALPDCLRLVIIGGERVLPERLVTWRSHGIPLMNCYGLTETTVTSMFFHVDPTAPAVDRPNLPIGTALPSVALRVLDSRLRPVPLGATGELYIGGISLARGYLARPGLTAQRFVADPDPTEAGGRLYRTGDLVRRRPDGNLEFIGRVDTQIKIRGFRVEPMEIESALSRHPGVAECVVAVHEPTPGDRRLVAYLVPVADAAPPVAELRRYLERTLPAYLVPSAFVVLDALPLSSNGKVERTGLPVPDGDRPEVGDEYVAPQSPVQRTLADVIAAVVGVAEVGIHDNFFEIGGDSILAIQAVARAQEAGLRLTPFDLFAHPTVAGLAEVATAGPTVDADQGDVTGPVPLAPTQHWFCTAGIEEPHHWNTSVLLELAAPGDPRLLGEAVAHLLAHHDGLRQRFLLAGERTRVRIAARGDVTPFAVYDLADLDAADRARRMAELTAELQTGLDLAVGPLVRFALVTFGGSRPDQVAVVAHRLVADPVSMRILVEDLRTALAQVAAGDPVTLPAKTTSWQSWVRRLVAYAATPPVLSQREYWSEMVDAPAARLPLDTAADPVAERAADTVASAGTVSAALDAADTGELLGSTPDALACTVDELLLAALSTTLSGWTGEPRHLVAVERHDRHRISDEVDLARTIGWFATTHPLALTAEPGSADATLKAVKEALRTVPTGGIGWELLRHGPDPLPAAATELAFTYLGEVDQPASGVFTVAAEPMESGESPHGRRRHLVDVAAAVDGERLTVRWRYSEHVHTRRTMEGLADRYVDELRALVELGRRATGRMYTPSDFPLARVDQAQLDALLGQL